MNPRIVIPAAGALLVGAIAIALYTQRADSSVPASADRSAKTLQSSAAASLELSDKSARNASRNNARTVKDEELVAKYGESRTKLARHVTGNIVEVLADVAEMGKSVSDMKNALGPNELPQALEGIKEKLALNDEQEKKTAKIFKDYEQRKMAAAGQLIDGMKSDPSPLMEMLLAGDAFKRGKMDEEEYQNLRTELSKNTKPNMDLLDGALGSEDALKDEAVQRELNSVFEPDQRETMQSFLAEQTADTENAANPEKTAMNLDKAIDLEQLDKKVASVKKMTSGMKSMLEGIGNPAEGSGLFGK